MHDGSSLSSKYGYGDFPLHTDGAHQKRPPDYICLFAPKTRATPTYIVDPRPTIDLESDMAKQAMFLVKRNGRVFRSRFVTQKDGIKFIRYNRDTMTPDNSAAQKIAETIVELRQNAVVIDWSNCALVVIDNRVMLHGRGHVETQNSSYIRRLELRL